MGGSANINPKDIGELVDAVFSGGEVRVLTPYSEIGASIREFSNAEEATAHIRQELDQTRSAQLAVFYVGSGPSVQIERLRIKPKGSDTVTFRYRAQGWGLIYADFMELDTGSLEAGIRVNSEKRAATWSETIPELGHPDDWDWPLVEKHTRRLVRVLRKLGKRTD